MRTVAVRKDNAIQWLLLRPALSVPLFVITALLGYYLATTIPS
jgi:hypothetical protein